MDPIKSFLEIAKLARKQVHKNLTIFPLLAPDGISPEYLTLEQALDQNLIQITELDTEGSVPVPERQIHSFLFARLLEKLGIKSKE